MSRRVRIQPRRSAKATAASDMRRAATADARGAARIPRCPGRRRGRARRHRAPRQAGRTASRPPDSTRHSRGVAASAERRAAGSPPPRPGRSASAPRRHQSRCQAPAFPCATAAARIAQFGRFLATAPVSQQQRPRLVRIQGCPAARSAAVVAAAIASSSPSRRCQRAAQMAMPVDPIRAQIDRAGGRRRPRRHDCRNC